MAHGTPDRDPLNGPLARLAAGLVFLAVAALLVHLNRYELFRPAVETSGLSPAVEACVAERIANIDDQIARGTITQDMAGPIRDSVVNFCRQTVGEGN